MRKLLFAFALLMLCVSAASAAIVGTVTGDKVPVMAKPSAKSEVLGEVNKGLEFEVIDTHQSEGEPYPWHQGRWLGGSGPGWVYGQFVSVEGPDESMWTHNVVFINFTEETVSVAIASEGDDRLPGAEGWYTIEAGGAMGLGFKVKRDAIGPGRPAKFYYYAKSKSKVWGGVEDQDLSYMIHPTKDFWCARNDQGLYGEAGGKKYDYAKNQLAPEGCEYVGFKELPKDGAFFVGKVFFKDDD